jgi:hypothetical protein
MKTFEPELGQMVFGQPFKDHKVSNLVEAALRRIRDELSRVMWNVNQEHYESPFCNTGSDFKCDRFEVQAYSWGDEEQPFNFKWRGVEISWYKYLGRGMSANTAISALTASEMLDDCLDALVLWEKSDEAKTIVASREAARLEERESRTKHHGR